MYQAKRKRKLKLGKKKSPTVVSKACGIISRTGREGHPTRQLMRRRERAKAKWESQNLVQLEQIKF